MCWLVFCSYTNIQLLCNSLPESSFSAPNSQQARTSYGRRGCSSGELLLKHITENVRVCSKLLDALMQLVKGHLVLQECPAERGFVVDVGDLLEGGGLGGCLSVKFLLYFVCGALELFEKGGCNCEEVNACEGFDLLDL